jgi:rod shape-determining protein MreB
MFTFRNLVSRLNQSSQRVTQPVSIDLGSSFTKIAVQKRLVTCEPSCIVRHRESGEVIAVGTAAAQLVGKIPPSVECLWPIRHGKVANIPAAQAFLSQLFQNLPLFSRTGTHPLLPSLLNIPVTLGYGGEATTVEQKALERVCQNLSHSVQLFSRGKALWQTLSTQRPALQQAFIIDLGGMTTEFHLFSGGEAVRQKVVQLGGEDFTQAVVHTIRQEYHCEIGWLLADTIKKELCRISADSAEEKKMTIRGRNILTSLPMTLTLNASSFDPSFSSLTEILFGEFKDFCQLCPTELLSSALDQGIFLTGGTALLSGLASFLNKRTQSECTVSESPFEDIVKGM